jgi:hypothetical protein
MIPMNELMQVNIAKVHNFFDDLAVMAPGDDSASLFASFLPSNASFLSFSAYMQNIAGLEDQFVMGNLGQRELTFRPDQLAKYTHNRCTLCGRPPARVHTTHKKTNRVVLHPRVHAELHSRFGVIKAHVLETVEPSTEAVRRRSAQPHADRLMVLLTTLCCSRGRRSTRWACSMR